MERGVARRDSARATPTKQQQKRNDKKKNATNNQANKKKKKKKKNTMNISYLNYLILEMTHCYVSIEMFIFANTGKAIL